jgi:regulator of protease activity HflC (stomatin/prohibitin superfamily)
MNAQVLSTNREIEKNVLSGWPMLPLLILLLLGDIVLFFYSLVHGMNILGHPIWRFLIPTVLGLPIIIILMTGFFTLQPNEARVLVLFGAYKGTVRSSGFHWGNPFYSNGQQPGFMAQMAAAQMANERNKSGASSGTSASGRRQGSGRNKVSLRARTLNMERIKVNDKRGNPVEIAAVVVWRVQDTAQAAFDVDNYEGYVQTQSETALRHLASSYAYDHGEENELTLRSGVEEVSQALRTELQARLEKAGVVVDDARLTHLAYAAEIAQAMLRRQQAEAVIAARQKIVHGAVSMVEMALKELAEKNVVTLDDERKAAMVSNLMVVLCGEAEVHPVINTGTLYT